MAKKRIFVIPFPTWTVSHATGKTDSVLTATHPSGVKAMPLFTTEDAAQSFLDLMPAESSPHVIRQVTNPVTLLGLLAIVASNGVTHVINNPASQEEEISFVSTISEIQDYLIKKIDADSSLWRSA